MLASMFVASLEATAGSVMPKHERMSPSSSGLSHFSFCAAVPKRLREDEETNSETRDGDRGTRAKTRSLATEVDQAAARAAQQGTQYTARQQAR